MRGAIEVTILAHHCHFHLCATSHAVPIASIAGIYTDLLALLSYG